MGRWELVIWVAWGHERFGVCVCCGNWCEESRGGGVLLVWDRTRVHIILCVGGLVCV